jgi:hypothetical protein
VKKAQNVAQPGLDQNEYITFFLEIRGTKIWATFVIKKTTKANNHTLRENSPNLVTLTGSKIYDV